MKKIKVIVAAILRGTLLIFPGVAFAAWQWGKAAAAVNLLAAVGVEVLFLCIFAFIAVAADVARKRRAGESIE